MERDSKAEMISSLSRRRGDYGIDAPGVLLGLASGGFVLTVAGVLLVVAYGTWAVVLIVGGTVLLVSSASFLYTTRRGKFVVWARLLVDLGLNGQERILDLGCGRGAVMLMAAQLVPSGRVVGIDLWRTVDQSGNDPVRTEQNAALEGVRDRIELRTGDVRHLPFDSESFDLVLASMTIHNIRDPEGRAAAIDEAVRVLRPGGRITIIDIEATGEYSERLQQQGLVGVTVAPLGWRFWYGGPWVAARLVSADKSG